ncbi:MAG: ABC transporter permease subunit [Bdellovibrionaceae bacterium]|nr:ABC transporter permease subunit [Pseudobdellovibrionaceae bacterium]
MIRSGLRAGLIVFLLFPFLFLIWNFPVVHALDRAEFLWAAGNSFWQAFGSASLSLLFGLWGACGLIRYSSPARRSWRRALEVILLIPNFLPPLFVLLAALNLVDPFPMGLPGVIFIHTLMNWGLVAVVLAGLIEDKAGATAELALVEGASRRFFWRKALLPLLARDLGLLWLFVFAVCFGSFAIPLVVGGGRGTTLEVLIYEKIRLSTDWGQAVLIASLQSLFLFALSWIVARGRPALRSRRAQMRLLEMKSGVLLILLFSALLLWGYLQGFPAGWEQAGIFREMTGDLRRAFMGSLGMGLFTGFFCFGSLLLTSALLPSAWFEKVLSGYMAPSSALTSFAFLLLTPNTGFWPFVKIPLAVSLVSLPVLWRLGWQGALDSLSRQREVAKALGASEFLLWWRVLVPQTAPLAGTLAGLAAVWACGDFAMSRILAHRDLTLAMMTETLISSGYRLGLATVVSGGVLASALICFLIMKGAGHVLGRKPLS